MRGPIYLVLIVVAFALIVIASLRKFKSNILLHNSLMSLSVLLIGVSCLLSTGSYLILGLDGVVTGYSSQVKGMRKNLKVKTEVDGDRSILADVSEENECALGSHIYKPAWSLKYQCNGAVMHFSSRKIFFWIRLIVGVLFCGLGLGSLLAAFKKIKNRT